MIVRLSRRQQREVVIAGRRLDKRFIGRWKITQDLGGNRIDPARRNDVAGKRRTPRASGGVARRRIVNLMRTIRAQVASVKRNRRNRSLIGIGFVILGPFIIGEKEDLVALDRSAKPAAELVVSQMSHSRIEERTGVESAVLNKFVYRAIEAVAAGPQNQVRDRARAAAQFRVVIAGRNTDGLDGFGGRDQNLKQSGALVVIDSFDLQTIGHARLAVDLGLQRTGSVEKLRVLEISRRGSRH